MDANALRGIGLTEGETRVYLALLKLGQTKTGPLAKEADVSSSKVYKILDRLEKKGLVGHTIKGKTKFYTAMEPKRILDYIEERRNKLSEQKNLVEKMLPELERRRARSREQTEATLYTGFKAVTNFVKSILDELDEGEVYYVIGGGYGNNIPHLRKFFSNHHRIRAERGIRLKMLANYDVRDNLEETTRLNSEVRFLPQYLLTNTEIFFYRDKTFIAVWTKQPTGVLIESKEATEAFKSYFNAFWKTAEKTTPLS
ncbi:MAG: helix-turn-helix domain-containing protein [Candidatus Altiarchaeota archaeon]